MPERDSDRIIYEKLKNYKADYSSADWEQMETMLPRKSRTPYYAIAALLLLLLGSAGVWLGTGGFNQEQPDNAIAQQESSDKPGSITGNDRVIAGSTDLDAAQNREGSEQATSQNGASAESSATISEIRAHDKVFGKNVKPETSLQEERKLTVHTYGKGGVETAVAENSQMIEGNNNTSSERVQRKSEEVDAENGVASNSNRTRDNTGNGSDNSDAGAEQFTVLDPVAPPAQQSSSSEVFTVSNSTIATTSETAESRMEEGASVFTLNKIESGLIQSDEGADKTLIAKDALNGGALPTKKPKKQIVSFAMGGGAGMNFSFTNPALFSKPGYSVDLEEEVMFIKRIGLSLTQGYTERRYDGGAYPCPEGILDCPNSYSSAVRSMDFGVDVKANLVNKTKWNWYVKAGVINTVKIREFFSYNYPEIDTVTPPPTLPVRTNFNGTTTEIMFDEGSSFGLSADPVAAPDLTISGIKRYHVAYHVATGFDVAINSRLKMQVEAGHQFTEAIVGEENNRLQSFGANARVLYRFGN